MDEMKRDTEKAIKELVRDYKSRVYGHLTEGDVTSSLASVLRSELPPETVHTELRSVDAEGRVIAGKPRDWIKGKRGCSVDLSIMDKGRLKGGVDPRKMKYWRFVSFPVEAFSVVIEVKIRVSGNKRNIKADIDKLGRIKEKNEECLVYMVVLDRLADEQDLREVAKEAKETGVRFISCDKLQS